MQRNRDERCEFVESKPPRRFGRSSQMIECLRSEWLYSEKRPRDLLFGVIARIVNERPPMMVAQLTREAAHRASAEAARTGQPFDNPEAVTRAVVKTLLMAGALRHVDGSAIPFDVAAQAAVVGGVSGDLPDRAEAFLIEFLIHGLGDVTPADHRALAHALFRQFDARVPLEDLEDRVAVLLARLRDRVTLTGNAYAARALSHR